MRIIFIILTLMFAGVTYASNHLEPLNVKVLIVTTFLNPQPSEAGPWLAKSGLSKRISIKGLKHGYAFCKPNGNLCMIITGKGQINMTASLMAIGLSPKLDLSKTFIILSGIAGGNPDQISFGSVALASWIVNGGLVNAIDQRQLPKNMKFPFFRQGCTQFWCDDPLWKFDFQAVKLNSTLVKKAYQVVKNIELKDSSKIKKLRSQYTQENASKAPQVKNCDNLSASFYWAGSMLNRWAEAWSKVATENKANFCSSAMEDSAFIVALRRLDEAGLVDANRALSLRSISDLTINSNPNMDPIELLVNQPAVLLATENVYRVASFLAKHIIKNWDDWGKK